MKSACRFILFPSVLIFSFFIFSGMEALQYREEIGTLKDQAASEGEKAKLEKSQEDAYQAVDKAMKSKSIAVGIKNQEFLKRFGEPNARDKSNEGERWLYRSTKGKQFEKPWHFFYFDPQGKLLKWECGHTVCD